MMLFCSYSERSRRKRGEGMNVGSLFSGIGGIELGFEREGFKTRWFVENNPYCQAVLKKNFPNTIVYGDIRAVDFREVETVDILTGGFPCQDVSYAGKRKGMAGERTGLWKEYARAISEIRPRYAVMENVPGLITLGLDEVLADLAEIGYDAEWTTLCASDFGALHRRERIFIIAYSASGGSEFREHNRQSINTFVGENEKITERKNRRDWINSNTSYRVSSNSDSERRRGRSNETLASAADDAEVQGRGSPCFFTDDWVERVQGFREESLRGERGFSWCKDVRGIEELKGRQDIPEPLFRGTRDGVPYWVDRIKSLGNGVVPECAQFIARQIKEKEGQR
jgi:DNA (cytosine-5)-methyltransferase 1